MPRHAIVVIFYHFLSIHISYLSKPPIKAKQRNVTITISGHGQEENKTAEKKNSIG